MAAFDQDLILFEDDTIVLRYTFTDLETPFNSTTALWWGTWKYSDWAADPRTGTIEVQKANTWTGGSPNPTSTGNISVVNGDFIVNVTIQQSDFDPTAAVYLETDTEYYTELVMSPNQTEAQSLVSATGKLFVSSSIFSVSGFRP